MAGKRSKRRAKQKAAYQASKTGKTIIQAPNGDIISKEIIASHEVTIIRKDKSLLTDIEREWVMRYVNGEPESFIFLDMANVFDECEDKEWARNHLERLVAWYNVEQSGKGGGDKC